MNHLNKIFLFLLVAISLASCRKDVDVPDPSLEKLFGKWQLVSATGGMMPGILPGSDDNHWIEINRNGIYKGYDGNKLEEKWKFEFNKISTNNSNDKLTITYHTTKRIRLKHEPDKIGQDIEFRGDDTLWLNDRATDSYNYCYVRKK